MTDDPHLPPTLDTNLKSLTDGDFVIVLKDVGKAIQGHAAFQGELPEWIPNWKKLFDHSDLLAEAISKTNRDKSNEADKIAQRKRAQQAINFTVQYLTMYSVHHNDPSALENIGLAIKHKSYNRDARRAAPGKLEKLEIYEVKDDKGEETDRLLIVVGKLPERGSVELQYTDNPDDPSSWQTAYHLYEARSYMAKGNLERVKKYYFRGRYCTAGGVGEWSKVLKHVVL